MNKTALTILIASAVGSAMANCPKKIEVFYGVTSERFASNVIGKDSNGVSLSALSKAEGAVRQAVIGNIDGVDGRMAFTMGFMAGTDPQGMQETLSHVYLIKDFNRANCKGRFQSEDGGDDIGFIVSDSGKHIHGISGLANSYSYRTYDFFKQ